MQQAGTAGYKLDDMEFGRRLALEKEIQKLNGGQASTVNASKYIILKYLKDKFLFNRYYMYFFFFLINI